ncbi:unnamed protein product [Caenorhabditis nigoni]
MNDFGMSDLIQNNDDGTRGTSGNENEIAIQKCVPVSQNELPNKTLTFRLDREFGSLSREWKLDENTDFIFKSSITRDGNLLVFGESPDSWRLNEEITNARRIGVIFTGALELCFHYSILDCKETKRFPHLHFKIEGEYLTISSHSGDSSHSLGMIFPMDSSPEGLGILLTVIPAEEEECSPASSPELDDFEPTYLTAVPAPSASDCQREYSDNSARFS